MPDLSPTPGVSRHGGGGRRAAFFDLDRTLIPGSSLFHLARGLHRRRFVGVGELVRFGWKQLVYRVGKSERSPAMGKSRETALAFVRGRAQPEVRALTEEISVERIVPRVYPKMAEVIEGHRSAGDLTFLVTAAPTELSEAVAEKLGMTGGIGTDAEVDDADRYSGELLGPVLHGEAKAGAVEHLATTTGIDLDASAAYSDSINDRPLLELVGGPAVVNPDRELRKLATDKGWPVHDCRPGRRRARRPAWRRPGRDGQRRRP